MGVVSSSSSHESSCQLSLSQQGPPNVKFRSRSTLIQLLAGVGILILFHWVLTSYGYYDAYSGYYSDVSYHLGRQFGAVMRPFHSLKTSESTSPAAPTSAFTYDIAACPGPSLSLSIPFFSPFTPVPSPGYKLDPLSIHATPSSFTAHLSLAGPPCNAFGRDIAELVLSVVYEERHKLHVHVYDREERQFQIPESLLLKPQAGEGVGKGESDLEVSYI